LDNLLPIKEMLFHLRFELPTSSFFNLRTDSLIIGEFAVLIVDLLFNLLLSIVQITIDLFFDFIDVGLIKSLVLVEDLFHSFLNHFIMLFNHFFVFKVVCD
jgi:hypothetical protein